LRQHLKTTVYIDYNHLLQANQVLAAAISSQYFRMEHYLRKAIQNLVKEYDPLYLKVESGGHTLDASENREFWIGWYGLPNVKRLREMRMDCHGKLLAISGTVTRTSEVRPELLYGTFACADCGAIIKDIEQEFNYTEPTSCHVQECGNRTNFTLLTEQSKFADWQKVRIQESADQVPSGAMPRSIDVILRNETVEKAKAGDRVKITGTALVVPDVGQLIGSKVQARRDAMSGRGKDGFAQEGVTGLKVLGVRDLTYKLVFVGSFVQNTEMKNALNALHDLDDDEDLTERLVRQFTEKQILEIQEMKNDRRLYQKLANSICPHIYGFLVLYRSRRY
jgi:DNA replication licensing factor MCM6